MLIKCCSCTSKNQDQPLHQPFYLCCPTCGGCVLSPQSTTHLLALRRHLTRSNIEYVFLLVRNIIQEGLCKITFVRNECTKPDHMAIFVSRGRRIYTHKGRDLCNLIEWCALCSPVRQNIRFATCWLVCFVVCWFSRCFLNKLILVSAHCLSNLYLNHFSDSRTHANMKVPV